MRKDITLAGLWLVKYPLSTSLEVHYRDTFKNPMRFLLLDLKTKLITSESILGGVYVGGLYIKD